MAQGLHLSQKMALQQVLAPQLQQSLALLQAPALELKALVEQEMSQNPLLEEVTLTELSLEDKETSDREAGTSQLDPREPPTDTNGEEPARNGGEEGAEPADDFQAELQKLTQLDQDWRDHFSQTNVSSRRSPDEEERRQHMFDSLVASTSLQEHLQEQVRLSDLTDHQRSFAELIIGNIDDYGYLKASVDEMAFSTNIPAEELLEVLDVIQAMDPPGVGARDLRECLLLQLQRAGREKSLEYKVVDQYMDSLGKRRLPEISRGLGLSLEQVQECVDRIRHLEPRPGRGHLPDDNHYISPEITVQKVGVEYVVVHNKDHIPHLRISNTYKDLLAQAESSHEVRDYIRDKIRAGKFLIKSIHQRQETILNIARELVKRQFQFMEVGVTALRPMTMGQIAEAVGVHETTVSRAVAGKYIDTPQGIFDMKYFFTAGISKGDGEGISNATVKDMISDMVKQEDSAKPLSDEEIVKRLAQRDIIIARRTAAKYRSELNILPSHLRKFY